MSDNEDPLLAIIVGAVFGAVIIILGFRFLIVRCDKTKKNNNSSSTVKVIPSKSLSTPVVPQKIKLRRKVTHDPNNTEPRKIIERIRIGIELIFKEFDQSRDGLIDTQEVRKCPQEQQRTTQKKIRRKWWPGTLFAQTPQNPPTMGTVPKRLWPLLFFSRFFIFTVFSDPDPFLCSFFLVQSTCHHTCGTVQSSTRVAAQCKRMRHYF